MKAIEIALCSHVILPLNSEGQEDKIPVLIANSYVIVWGISKISSRNSGVEVEEFGWATITAQNVRAIALMDSTQACRVAPTDYRAQPPPPSDGK